MALLAGLGVFFQYLSRNTKDDVWLWASIVCAVGSVLVVPIFKHFDEKASKTSLLKYQEEIGDGLEPLLQQLVTVSEAKLGEERNRQIAALVRVALEAARHMAGQGRVRAAYYRAYPRKGAKREHLKADYYIGRGTKPKTEFARGSESGDYVFKMLNNNDSIFERDTSKCDLPGWNGSRRRDYKTFISVPVRGSAKIYGMLTVDAPEVGELTDSDEMFVRCVGLLLAAGIATASPSE